MFKFNLKINRKMTTDVWTISRYVILLPFLKSLINVLDMRNYQFVTTVNLHQHINSSVFFPPGKQICRGGYSEGGGGGGGKYNINLSYLDVITTVV